MSSLEIEEIEAEDLNTEAKVDTNSRSIPKKKTTSQPKCREIFILGISIAFVWGLLVIPVIIFHLPVPKVSQYLLKQLSLLFRFIILGLGRQ